MSEENFSSPKITSNDKTWALLSYLFSPLVPIIILLIEEKKNRPFLKAHYPQALVWGIVVFVLSSVLSFVLLGFLIFVFSLVMSIIWGIKAYNGEYVTIPVITKFCKKQGWAG